MLAHYDVRDRMLRRKRFLLLAPREHGVPIREQRTFRINMLDDSMSWRVLPRRLL